MGATTKTEEAGECQIRVLRAAGADRGGLDGWCGKEAMFGAVWFGGAGRILEEGLEGAGGVR